MEVTEESHDASQESKAQAMEAISEGDAVQCLYVGMPVCVCTKSVASYLSFLLFVFIR